LPSHHDGGGGLGELNAQHTVEGVDREQGVHIS
jgi:hypothetical protein